MQDLIFAYPQFVLNGGLTPLAGEWDEAIRAWLLVLVAAGRPRSTVGLRRYQVTRMGRELGVPSPWLVTGGDLLAWFGGQDWSAETRRSWRAAARGFWRWGHAEGLVELDPALALPSVKPAQPRPRPAPEDAYRLALARADERTRLMLRLAAELGLRRGEVARVHSDDLFRDLTGWSLRVVGKGDRVRVLPVPDGLAGLVRGHGPGWLFPGNDHGHLSARYVGRLVARVLPEAWAMHSLRHRFATAAYSHDRDLLTVQELLGHASPVTTRIYVQVPAESLRRTVAAVGRL